MKTRHKLRIAADISAATLLISGAVTALILAPEIGIALAPPMIEGALVALNDAKNLGLKNPLRFFHRKRTEADKEHHVPRHNPDMS